MKRTSLVVAALLALLAAAGIAYATIPDSSGVIHGCYQKNVGNLRVVDPSSGDACRASEVALDWSQTGPPGPQGAQGPQGPQGPQGAQGPPGPTHAYTASADRTYVDLEGAGGTTVTSVKVPAGSYVVWATGIAAIAQPGRLHCYVAGDEWSQDDSGAYSAVGTLTFSSPGTITLHCSDIFAGPIYVSSNQLVAMAVDAIN